jgi:hypothetical protein
MATYLFLDEAGNFDFEPSGARHLVLGCVSMSRPFFPARELMDLKYDLIERGNGHLSHFHASEDRQAVRDAFLDLLEQHLDAFAVDLLVVDKPLAVPGLRSPQAIYPWALAKLLRPILRELPRGAPVHVFTDRLPVNHRRESTEKAIKSALAKFPPDDAPFQLLHHESRTNLNLQVADYATWAAFRKWERGDVRSYERIRKSIRSERLAFGLPSK